jgi:P27 family predicted phage terminase small subunit
MVEDHALGGDRMARPAKSVNAKSGVVTKEEVRIRQDAEKKLRGSSNSLKPPSYLTTAQKKIFKYIVSNLEEAEILGNLDLYILSVSAVTIGNLIELDTQINNEKDVILKVKLMSVRDKYTKDFFRCCNELSLSPQSRAKLSLVDVKASKESRNPLLEALDL